MEVRWTHHALYDKLPELAAGYGLVLTREIVEDIIHNPEWVEQNEPPSTSRAEKHVQGQPVRVIWRDVGNSHLVITVFVAREPHI